MQAYIYTDPHLLQFAFTPIYLHQHAYTNTRVCINMRTFSHSDLIIFALKKPPRADSHPALELSLRFVNYTAKLTKTLSDLTFAK